MAKVYISSTYEDLREQRNMAIEAVRRLEHQAVCMETYGASSRAPIEKCLEDVRSCDAYVGIIAWRYGSSPADSEDGKSFTHLEFEAAQSAKIPCFVFLSPEAEEWGGIHDQDPGVVTALRDHVRNETVCDTFTDPRSVRENVTRALNKEIERARRIPELLPYLCDRVEQRSDIGTLLRRAQERSRTALPVLGVLHGDEDESHVRFLDCLKSRYVARILGQPDDGVSVREFRLRWPRSTDPNAFVAQLVNQLGDAVCRREGVPLDAIARGLSDLRTPVLFSVQLPVNLWGDRTNEAQVHAFARFWMEWEHSIDGGPVIVLLWAPYQLPEPAPGGLWSRLFGSRRRARVLTQRNTAVKSAIESLRAERGSDERFAVLTRLDAVAEDDAMNWAEMSDVLAVVGDSVLVEDVRQLYDRGRDEIPMEPLAKELRDLLRAACRERGS